MFKKYLVLGVCLLSMFLIAMVIQDKQALKQPGFQDQEVMIVGTNAEYPPFSFYQDDVIVGFDIDIAKEVCRRLDKNFVLKNMPFDALIPEVALGHIHFVAAGMSYTEERAKRVLFTQSYVSDDPLVILIPKKDAEMSNQMTLDDLQGKIIAVNEGYTSDLFLSSKTGFELVRLPAPVDAFVALKSGRADAFVTAKSTLDAFLSTQDSGDFFWSEIDGTTQSCALVVSKKQPKLLLDIQNALEEMTQDGSLTKIKEKWGLK